MQCPQQPPRPLRHASAAAFLALTGTIVSAQQTDQTQAAVLPVPGLDWSLRTASFHQPDAEPTDPFAIEDGADPTTPTGLPDYGEQGGNWLTFGTGLASNFTDAEDAYGFIQYNYFIADDFEWAIELGGWALDDKTDYTAGVSVSSIFRWHFYRDDTWTTFADVGVGMLLAGHKVPDDGTNFNFLPRVGFGATYRLGESRSRLIGGLRWHHISNARIQGNDSNPGRDSAMLYLGVTIPF